MLKFKPVNVKTGERLRRYYDVCTYRLCEYSVGVKLMWRGYFHPEFAEYADCLIVKNKVDGRHSFDYPVPLPGGDVDAALDKIDEYCRQRGISPAFNTVPAEAVDKLARRYPFISFSNDRRWQDYLYNGEDLMNFAGRKYSGQRNHVNKFTRTYPGYKFMPLSPEDDLTEFWEDFSGLFGKNTAIAKKELKHAKELMTLAFEHPWFCTGSIRVDGRIIAVCLAEKCGETLVVHIEKALYEYEGVYPTMVREFSRYYGGNVKYFNREDDACDKGLRTSKTQYQPCMMGEKFSVVTKNELAALQRVPTMKSQRLTMTPIRESDVESYNALCLDDERNRWWGYDYRKDLKGELTRDYFLKVARSDFRRRAAVNFALRLEDEFIGEAVLHNFDSKGEAELGCRVLPEFAGHGYGAEAFSRVADWSLYSLGLRRLVAKCYKENDASYRMLSACMKRTGEDDTFFYFEKTV